MNDPLDDQLRQALHTGAAAFSPTGGPGEAKGTLGERIRTRRRRQASVVVVAALLVVSAAGVAYAARLGHSSGHQVAARGASPGASPGASTSNPASSVGVTGAPGVGFTSPPSSSSVFTTGQPPASVPTTVRPATIPTTMLPTSTPPTPPTSTPPTSIPPGHGASTVGGTVRFSPTCPVEQVPPLPSCGPRPGPAQIQLVRPNGSVAATGAAGTSGDFAIAVAPGTYTVRATASGAIGRGCSVTPAQVDVALGATVTVAVSCDTGIR